MKLKRQRKPVWGTPMGLIGFSKREKHSRDRENILRIYIFYMTALYIHKLREYALSNNDVNIKDVAITFKAICINRFLINLSSVSAN